MYCSVNGWKMIPIIMKMRTVHKDVIDSIMERYKLPDKERDFLDASIMDVACKFEKNAFYGGFAQGLNLITGKIFISDSK